MKLEHYNPELEIADDAYAWRYVSFSKLWNIVNDNEIYFTRLDGFDDPMEGMPTEYIQPLYYANVNRYDRSYKKEKLPSLLEVENWQNGIFSSCWYLTERKNDRLSNHEESLAMWNLYSDSYDFVIKIKFSELQKMIETALRYFIDSEVKQAFFCKVEYLSYFDDFYPRDPKKANIEILRSSVKHLSYQHENELRFLLLAQNDNLNRKGIKLKLKTQLKDINPTIEIFSHPNMDDEVFFTFKNKFKELGFILQHSKLLTSKVIRRYIK
jgi:hypothetical protein